MKSTNTLCLRWNGTSGQCNSLQWGPLLMTLPSLKRTSTWSSCTTARQRQIYCSVRNSGCL